MNNMNTAQAIAAIKAQLEALEAQLSEPAPAPEPAKPARQDRKAEAMALVLRTLEAAPGPLTMPEIQEKTEISKPNAHRACEALATAGKVWLQKFPIPDRPGRFVTRVGLPDRDMVN